MRIGAHQPSSPTASSGATVSTRRTSSRASPMRWRSRFLGDLTYVYDAAGNRLGTGGSWARVNLPAALAAAELRRGERVDAVGFAALDIRRERKPDERWDQYLRLGCAQPVGVDCGTDDQRLFDTTPLAAAAARAIGGSSVSFLYDGQNPVQESDGSTPCRESAERLVSSISSSAGRMLRERRPT